MVVIQQKSRRKATGGRYKSKVISKKVIYKGSEPTLPKIGKDKIKSVRTRGGNTKVRTMLSSIVNLFDGKSYSKEEIVSVAENAANRHYVRRNILTKGTIIETKKGKAKITNRPGQEGTVNAVLMN